MSHINRQGPGDVHGGLRRARAWPTRPLPSGGGRGDSGPRTEPAWGQPSCAARTGHLGNPQLGDGRQGPPWGTCWISRKGWVCKVTASRPDTRAAVLRLLPMTRRTGSRVRER